MDLLTVVRHELGHVLGLDDITAGSASTIMDDRLEAGERVRLSAVTSELSGTTAHRTQESLAGVRVFDEADGVFRALDDRDDDLFTRGVGKAMKKPVRGMIHWDKVPNP